MRYPIATQFHKIREILVHNTGNDLLNALTLYDEAYHVPHYLMDIHLMDTLNREDMVKSVQAVIKAGVRRLPFPKMVMGITITDATMTGASYTLIEELQNGPYDFRCVPINYLRQGDKESVSFPKGSYFLKLHNDGIEFHTDMPIGLTKDQSLHWMSLSLYCAILLLHTRGVEKRVIDTTQLNKSRVKSGKYRIPTHTVLRIGTVYDRDNKPTKHDPNSFRKVHWRAAHIRNQRYGKDWSETRIIYIPPALVNYVDGPEPTPLPKVIRV